MNIYTESARNHAIKIARDNVTTFEKQLAEYESQRATTADLGGLERYIIATIRDLEWSREQLRQAEALPIQPDLLGNKNRY